MSSNLLSVLVIKQNKMVWVSGGPGPELETAALGDCGRGGDGDAFPCVLLLPNPHHPS